MKETIIWFQDGVKLKSDPQKWREIDVLTQRLINLIGHPDFNHRIIDPTLSKGLLRPDSPEHSSVCIDLTGTGIGEKLFPEIPQIQNFHLSRVRNVTSPRLDGCGHLISHSPEERMELLSRHDISKPLILDDVVWSGRTAIEVIKALGLSAADATFAAFAMNTGHFGEGKPGAANLLKSQGVSLRWGVSVATPQDDGFHLADFFDHPFVAKGEVFDVLIRIEQIREAALLHGDTPEINQTIKTLLEEHRQVLFPNARSTEDMKIICSEGRLLVTGGLSKNSFFDINPLNWLMPSFSRRIRSEMMSTQKRQILDTLKRFQDIIR